MKKRLFLSIMMFLPMLASADPVEIDGICYNLVEETKAAEVTANYNIYRGDITIPESVEYEGITYSVTSIGGYAFYYCTGLKSVTIPNSVITIGESAFQNCKNLSSVTIANGVTSIGVAAFQMCTSLTSLTIPNSVTAIAESAFQGCSGLQSIVVDKGNTVYDSREDCNALIKTSDNKLITGCMNTTIPNSITAIGSWAFFLCDGLTSINIPNSVTGIEQSAFWGCKNLVSINIPNSVTEIEEQTFSHCEALTSITIPNSVTTIGDQAFYECIGLTSITIGSKVKSIGFLAFTDCLNLLDVYCYAEKVPETQNEVFRSANIENATLHVPAASISAYQAVEPWKNFKEIVALKEAVMIDETTFIDSKFRNWVLSQEYGADGILTNEELDHVPSIDISRLGIQYLMGIEYFTALKELNCMTNNLSMLNLSNNIALEKLLCDGNELMSLNLLKNKELKYLNCVANNLTSIDVSGCTELDTLACSGNQLTILDVSKNTKLICLECYSNQLKSLDLSKNTALRRVHCNKNQLTTLDVSKNTALTLLVCSNNLLTTLDVTKNSALTYLTCMDNKLTTLYVSDNKSLKELSCFNNQLTSLDVSGCSALKTLGCRNNQLATLNLSGCSALDYVDCHSNQLETLDLSENTALTTLFCFQNKIKGIGMDALVESLPTVSEGSLNVMYVNNEQNVMTTTQVAAAKAKGWTPYIWEYSISEEYAGTEAPEMAYRPMIEDGKVWKVGSTLGISDGIVKMVAYYYFNGDTIIDGKTCKLMMCQRYVSPDLPDNSPSLTKVGAWYEEDKKVYLYDEDKQSMVLMYDFSIGDNENLSLIDDYPPFMIGPKQTGGIEGFKGAYRDVMIDQNIMSTTWLEGVGGIEGPTRNAYPETTDHVPEFLMSCTVGDEVIYLNDEYEDGATPEEVNAKKHRFDFNHTIKTKPKTRGEAQEQPLYGEYNDLRLGINLDPLGDVYQVRITDESGNVVYEKAVNTVNIVALSIDISAYAKGRYTVIVENNNETFTGEIDKQTTGIKEVNNDATKAVRYYSIDGKRISTPQRGLNIIRTSEGKIKKIVVKW